MCTVRSGFIGVALLCLSASVWSAPWRWQSIRRFDPPANIAISAVHFQGDRGLCINGARQVNVSTDAGAHWHSYDLGPLGLDLMASGELLYDCLATSSRLIVVGDNHIIYSTDTGASWHEASYPSLGTNFTFRAVDADPDNPNFMMLVGGRRTSTSTWQPLLLMSSDGGVHWGGNLAPSSANLPRDLRFRHGGRSIIVDFGGHVYQSTDDAHSWSLVAGMDGFFATCLYSRENHIWIGGSRGRIKYSVNNGATWREYSLGVSKSIYALAFLSATVGIAVCPPHSIYHTLDRGATWTEDTVSDVYALGCATVCRATGHNFLVGGRRYNLPVVLAEKAPIELLPRVFPRVPVEPRHPLPPVLKHVPK
ncbi:MAG: hypothetical protein J7M26_01895 [Armatimonadetes bacterium]|nr:hypothetical protein [Armatimonadota bacterium]